MRSKRGSSKPPTAPRGLQAAVNNHGRFPKFHRVLFGRDPGALKSDIVSATKNRRPLGTVILTNYMLYKLM